MAPLAVGSARVQWLMGSIEVSLVLYTLVVAWPAYQSGLAAFAGDPKWEWTMPIEVWYLRDVRDPALIDWLAFGGVLVSMVAGRFLLIPLSVVLLASTLSSGAQWPRPVVWRAVLLSGAAIAVPLLTWTAANQLMRWLID